MSAFISVNRKKKAAGFTLIEIAVAMAVLIVVISIALPNFMKMRMTANEAAVIGGMKAMAQACETFRRQGIEGGQAGYPLVLRALTDADPPYLPAQFRNLGAGWKGYQWTYLPGGQRLTPVGGRIFILRDSYILRADPVRRGMDGQRSFYLDQTGVLRFNAQGPAGPNDPIVE